MKNTFLTLHEQKVIELLADGNLYSGEKLSSYTNTTRAHIWKIIRKLNTLGLPIQSKKAQGYWIEQGLDLLNETKILSCLDKNLASLFTFNLFSLLPSTNQYLLQKIKRKNSKSHDMFSRRANLRGVGRRGQSWHSPFGQNIYLSLYWCMDNNLANLTGLPLIVGLGIRKALCNLDYKNIQLKWPNDIYAQDKKLGGILVELVSDAVGACHMVIGIGLNVHMQPLIAEEQNIDQPWTSLALLEHKNRATRSRNLLIAKIIEKINDSLSIFEKKGLEPFLKDWGEADYLYSNHIEITTQDGIIQGQALGISSDGALQVDVNGHLHSYRGSAIRIRKL